MFESVGMCKEACEAYLKSQNVKSAVDCCVKLNQWDEGKFIGFISLIKICILN